MRFFIVIGLVAVIMNLTGCSSNQKTSNNPMPTPEAAGSFNNPVPTVTPEGDKTDELGIVRDERFYSMKSKDSSLIQLKNDETSVQEALGQPLKKTSPQPLGDGADTFSKMLGKTLEYDGLSLKFLGKSAEELWLSEIEISKSEYETSEGIKVGDSLEALQSAYPSIKYMDTMLLEDKPNSKVYGFRQDELGFFADFIVDGNDQIEGIHMYFVFD
ncbi:hypothetical protein V3851_05920 [Paenibacillus sp. M1]|uniref:Lipoprotein n=1 Tax=Paenibacillus haidiansis TaxID=1574488 RepID=A0ABU7VNM8_9BACL